MLEPILAQFRSKTPAQIATIIRSHKIKGRMGTTHKCPMALLLDGIDTGSYIIGRKYIVRRSGNKIEQARTPDGVSAFIRKFDLGQYPDLVAPPPRCIAQPNGHHQGSDLPHKTRKRHKEVKNHLAKLVGRFSS